MATGGTGTGLGQDATVQQMLKKLGLSIPQGGTGTGLAQDATFQKLLEAIGGGGGSGGIAFVYQPGGTASANVYTSWAALYTALSVVAGPKTIQIDDSFTSPAVIPAGAYNLDGVTFTAVVNFSSATGGAVMQLASGVTFTFGQLTFTDALLVQSQAIATVYSVGAGVEANLYLLNGSQLDCLAAGAFMDVQAGGFGLVFAHHDVSVGDGVHTVFTAHAASGIELFATYCSIANNAVGAHVKLAFDQSVTLGVQNAAAILQPVGGTWPLSTVQHFGVVGDGTADDTAATQTAMNTAAAAGLPLQFATGKTGNYKITAALTMPSGLEIWGNPDVTLTASALVGWLLQAQYAPGEATRTPNTTLAANTTVGATTVSLTANTIGGSPVVATTKLLITDANYIGQIFTVKSIAGMGPYTVTLDRPIQQALLAAGSVVQIVTSQPTDIRIQGNGMKIAGVFSRALDIMGATRCYVSDLEIDASQQNASNYTVSMDLYGLENTLERVHVDGGGNANVAGCVATESNERTQIIDCTAANGVIGIAVSNGIDVEVRNGSATGCTYGLLVGGDVASTGTSVRVRVVGGSYNGNTIDGAVVNGSSAFSGWLGAAQDTFFVGTSLCENQHSGLVVDVGTTGTHCIDIDLTQNGLSGPNQPFVLIGAGCVINGIRCASADNGGYLIETTAGIVIVRNVEMTVTAAANATIGAYCHGGTVSIDGMHLSISAGAAATDGILIDTGTLALQNMHVDGAGAGGGGISGIVSSAGTTVRLGSGVDVDACTTPLNIGGYCSKSIVGAANAAPVLANGASGVAVAWPNLKTTERVFISLLTKGGTPAFPDIALNPGTGFTLTSFAGDTSTYHYEVR